GCSEAASAHCHGYHVAGAIAQEADHVHEPRGRAELILRSVIEWRVAVVRMARDQLAENAAEKRRISTTCGILYRATANKRIADLTVREEQQVRACQALGLCPPE